MMKTSAPLTLRQRNRLATLQRIQSCAMDLFDQNGYQAVTIEDIAAAAGVSTSTFYRYVGTKEGIFTVESKLGLSESDFADFIDVWNLEATLSILDGLIGPGSFRGMKYIIEEPQVRSAMYRVCDVVIAELQPRLVRQGVPPLAARSWLRSLLFGVYLGALEQWHTDGRHGSPIDAIRNALATLRPLDELKATLSEPPA